VVLVVVQLVVVAAVEAAAVAPAAAKAAVVAVVAAPSVVGATLRSSFSNLAVVRPTGCLPLLLLPLPPPPCTCSDNQRLWDKGQCLGAQSRLVVRSALRKAACEARFSFFSTLSPQVSSRPLTHVSSTGTPHAVSTQKLLLVPIEAESWPFERPAQWREAGVERGGLGGP
jgi:hypothetical protein